ncbi:MAG: tryptophan synthase subunit alpha [Desulfuromonas sp.]|uniref:tryptophan synthase subunit alpha n=1 Tax=Desulfuromonas sp. TaxID=892 RepID=UPI000CAFF8BD|nr:tryptophan synthase subunit alpha [Desulfuromonas sp.]PLX83603.1 MAG: tryptophan synthase subunit alpha [Desulfuromonas sp.]
MGRIKAIFERLRQEGETALVPFLTAGDPDLATTEALIHSLVENGADLIELGFPFSDPMADGPTIQAASERALAAGTTLSAILDMIARVRLHTNVPIVLMGYFNPLFRYGPERFAADAAAAGVDGLLLVDLPPEEAGEIHSSLQAEGVDLITLLAPTTPPERAARLAAVSEGYLYFVSMTGVTGAQRVDAGAIGEEVGRLRAQSPVPVAVGFGISTPADAAAVASFADAVVVGSALVKIIEAHGTSAQLLPEVGRFVRSLKEAIVGKGD